METTKETSITPASRRIDPALIIAFIGMFALVVVAGATYSEVFHRLLSGWSSDPDLSHGFLVPLWSGYLLWLRRDRRPMAGDRVSWLAMATGLAVIGLGVAIHCMGVYYRSTTVETWSLLPYIFGVTLCCGGWKAAAWAWPSIIFLAFMLPLPASVSRMMGANLQHVATVSSTYLLQLIGIPAVSQGNVILLSEETIGVAEACNGLRMLTSFFALSIGACFVVQRPAWQKVIIALSAPIIGIIANVTRITVTGVAYEFGGSKLADAVFHDLAGWLMMPLGILLLALEMAFLSRVLLKPESSEPVRLGIG